MVLLGFFQEYSQGNKTPTQYDTDLCGLFDQFNDAMNPLSKSIQVMAMVHGRNEEYANLILTFCNSSRKFSKQDLSDLSSWYNWWSKFSFKEVLPRKKPPPLQMPPAPLPTLTPNLVQTPTHPLNDLLPFSLRKLKVVWLTSG